MSRIRASLQLEWLDVFARDGLNEDLRWDIILKNLRMFTKIRQKDIDNGHGTKYSIRDDQPICGQAHPRDLHHNQLHNVSRQISFKEPFAAWNHWNW